MVDRKPKVLISYSNDSSQHYAKILGLAQALQQDGIDCIIHDSALEEPTVDNGHQWIIEKISQFDTVLVILSKAYCFLSKQQGYFISAPNTGIVIAYERFPEILKKCVFVVFDAFDQIPSDAIIDLSREDGYSSLYQILSNPNAGYSNPTKDILNFISSIYDQVCLSFPKKQEVFIETDAPPILEELNDICCAPPHPSSAPRKSLLSQFLSPVAYAASLVSDVVQSLENSPSPSIEDELRRLETGKVVISAPSRMKVGVAGRVSVRIGRQETQELFANLPTENSIQPDIKDIKVGRYMSLALDGGSDTFKVRSLSDEEQLVLQDGVTSWDWSVLPLKAGKHALLIKATVIVKTATEQAKKGLPVLEKEIEVQINPVYSTQIFLEKNWQWLIASAIIPVAGWFFSKQ